MAFDEKFGIENAFLVAMAYQAKGDWAEILGMVKGKKYITPQEIEEGLDYIEKKGFGTPITFGSENYPGTLMKVTRPPFVVLAKGNRGLLYADEAQRNETLAVVISDKTPKSLIDYARTAMKEDLALVAVSTKDTMRTKFEKEVERYCEAGKGLLLTEGVNKSKERQEDIAKAVNVIDQLGFDYPDEEMLSEKISDLGLFVRYRTATAVLPTKTKRKKWSRYFQRKCRKGKKDMTLTPMEKENLERYQTKNPFLLVFAKKAKGDCDKILRLLKNKVPVQVDEIDDTVRYFKSRGFENWLVFGDENHTRLFKERASAMPPIVLFHKGNLELLEGKEKETYGAVIYEDMEQWEEDALKGIIEEGKPLVAWFTTDKPKTELEKEIESYCKAGNGLLLTEAIGNTHTRYADVDRGVYFLSAMGMTSLHRYAQAKKQEAEKENELE